MGKKFLVASDIHGSIIALDKVLEILEETHADKLILLGDTFGSNATEMVQKLNAIANKLTIVKGNNDWYFEPENAKFTLFEQTYENINGKLAYICHGHKFNDMYPEMYGAKIVLQGHVHRPFIEEIHGIIRVCPGSMAQPRFGSDKCYAIIDDKKISIYTQHGELVDEILY